MGSLIILQDLLRQRWVQRSSRVGGHLPIHTQFHTLVSVTTMASHDKRTDIIKTVLAFDHTSVQLCTSISHLPPEILRIVLYAVKRSFVTYL